MTTEESNFDGNWDDLCPHCSRPHREHINQDITYEHEGETIHYIHRMPCEEQRLSMTEDFIKKNNQVRTAIFLWSVFFKIVEVLKSVFINWWLDLVIFLWNNKYILDNAKGWKGYRDIKKRRKELEKKKTK